MGGAKKAVAIAGTADDVGFGLRTIQGVAVPRFAIAASQSTVRQQGRYQECVRWAATYPAASDSKNDEQIIEALHLVGLGHLAERLDEEGPWDKTLSGGEKQRLAFARIFLHKPDIVVLDEATSALDPASQDRLMALLTEQLVGTTVVSVGHRPELKAFHNRKIVLERRRGGAKFVTDIQLVSKPRGRLIRKWLRPRRPT